MESRRSVKSPTWNWRGPGTARAISTLLLLAPLSLGWAQRPSAPTQNAMAGSWVFGAKGCAKCHSINGVGNKLGPDLGQAELRTYYHLGAGFWNHYPQMAARMREQGIQPPRMSPEEMGDLIAFLTSVNYFDPPGDATKGQAAFTQKRCIRCHQIGGSGGVIGPSLDYLGQAGPIEVAAEMWNHGPAMREAMRAEGIERPSFTAGELANLLAYLRVAGANPVDHPFYVLPGRADRGRRLVEDKGCVRCHGFRGQGGGLGPDLARRDRPLSLLQFATLLWNKAPAMQQVMGTQGIAVPHLEPDEMADIVAYLYSIQYFQPQGNGAAAPALFQSKGCLNCHSFRGGGGRGKPAGDLAQVKGLASLAAVMAALWNHGRLVPTTEGSRPPWSKLTPEGMADITAYFVNAGTARR